MAFPTFQAAGAFVEAEVGGISPAWPAHQADDIGLLLVESDEHVSLSVPAGFKPVDGGRVKAWASAGFHATLTAYWCRATSNAMGSPTVDHAGSEVRACIITFRGCGTTGLPWAVTTHNRQETSGTAVSLPGITTVEPDTLVVGIVGHRSHVNSSGVMSGYTNADLANITERVDSATVVGSGSGIAVFTGEKAAAGAVGATTATSTHTGAFANLVIALDSVSREPDTYPYLQAFGVGVERNTAGDITPAWPAHLTNDIGILVVESGGWPIATPAGWTEFPGSPQNAGVSGASNATQLSIFWKRAASGAEGPATVTFVAEHIRARIITFRDCPPAGNPYDVSAGSNNNASPLATVILPGLTLTKQKVRYIGFASHGINNSNQNQHTGTPANVDLTALFEEAEDTSAIGSGWVLIVGKRRNPATIGTTTGALASANFQGWMSIGLIATQGIDIETELGSFTLTGQGAEVVNDYVIGAAQASFALTGNDAEVVVDNSIEILAETGQLVLTGNPVEVENRFGTWLRRPGHDNAWTKHDPLEE